MFNTYEGGVLINDKSNKSALYQGSIFKHIPKIFFYY